MLVQTTQKIDLIQSFVAKKYRNTQSFATKASYENALKRFYEFLNNEKGIDISEAIILLEEKKLDSIQLLDDYYTNLRNTRFGKKQKQYSNASIRTYLTAAKEFLRFLGFKAYNEDIKQVFTLPPIQDNSEPGLTKETLVRLLRNSPSKLQVAILVSCASGVRDGELVQLKVVDIDFQTNPVTINLRAEIVKGKIHPRKTHLTKEAANALKDYLIKTGLDLNDPNHQNNYIFLTSPQERIEYYKEKVIDLDLTIRQNPNDAIKFKTARTTYLHKISQLENQIASMTEKEQYDRSVRSSKHALITMLSRVVDSIPDLATRHENDMRDIHFHSFRYFFKTMVTDAVNSDFAEALMGHKSLKLTYYKKNDEQRRKSYLKAEPALTISDYTAIEAELEKTQEKQKEIEETYYKFKQILKQKDPSFEEFVHLISK